MIAEDDNRIFDWSDWAGTSSKPRQQSWRVIVDLALEILTTQTSEHANHLWPGSFCLLGDLSGSSEYKFTALACNEAVPFFRAVLVLKHFKPDM